MRRHLHRRASASSNSGVRLIWLIRLIYSTSQRWNQSEFQKRFDGSAPMNRLLFIGPGNTLMHNRFNRFTQHQLTTYHPAMRKNIGGQDELVKNIGLSGKRRRLNFLDFFKVFFYYSNILGLKYSIRMSSALQSTISYIIQLGFILRFVINGVLQYGVVKVFL